MFLDTTEKIMLNYLTGKIYYSPEFTIENCYKLLWQKGINGNQRKKIWGDNVYGWSNFQGFNHWMTL
jgi:hypothetical protein